MTWKDRGKETSVGVDLKEGVVEVSVTESTTYGDLFDENGELRLWEDNSGWTGFEYENGDYYRVNVLLTDDGPEYVEREQVDQIYVANSIEDHIRDPAAGAVGTFIRGASPPPVTNPPESVNPYEGVGR